MRSIQAQTREIKRQQLHKRSQGTELQDGLSFTRWQDMRAVASAPMRSRSPASPGPGQQGDKNGPVDLIQPRTHELPRDCSNASPWLRAKSSRYPEMSGSLNSNSVQADGMRQALRLRPFLKMNRSPSFNPRLHGSASYGIAATRQRPRPWEPLRPLSMVTKSSSDVDSDSYLFSETCPAAVLRPPPN